MNRRERCAKRRAKMHPYTADDTADVRGLATCAECHLPKANTVHDLPETTQAARDRDASILGERED